MTIDQVNEAAKDLKANDDWRELDARDSTRIDCDRKHMCGNQAEWGLNTDCPPFSYVCGYHRVVFEATQTFWKEPTK